MGSESSTLNGSDQLSYRAARMRNTQTSESTKVWVPVPAAPVELADVGAAQECLHRLIDAAQADALLEDFVAVDAGIDLGHGGAEHRVDRSHLGALPCGRHERAQVLLEERDVVAAAVLDPHRKAAGG